MPTKSIRYRPRKGGQHRKPIVYQFERMKSVRNQRDSRNPKGVRIGRRSTPRTSERTAQAALTVAIQQAQQARKAVGDTESLLAQLAGAQAAVALAKRDLRHATVRAPFDGLVVGLDIAEGAYASAGHPLFTLINAP
jgi:multidrug resistance efflux pump